MRSVGSRFPSGQILEIFEDKRKNKKRKEYSIKGITDEQEYSKSARRKRMMD
jgi:hypothetical protein